MEDNQKTKRLEITVSGGMRRVEIDGTGGLQTRFFAQKTPEYLAHDKVLREVEKQVETGTRR